MSIYAQHGYGKSDKISRGIEDGNIGGIILSPKDENPNKIEEYIQFIYKNFKDVDLIFDPQFYVSTITPAKEGNLLRYDYYKSNLIRANFMRHKDIMEYVTNTIDYQYKIKLNKIVSPTIIVDDFNDPWSQISLTMAQEAEIYNSSLDNSKPLLISICFNETALKNSEAVSEYLDMLSLLDVKGFYIVVKRENKNSAFEIDPQILSKLMYFSYTLSTINQYEVIFGYTDFVGIPIYCTGIKAMSTGWFNGLKQFTLSRFQPSTGGRRPLPRYTSKQLLNAILQIPELQTIYELGMIDSVISNTKMDSALKVNPAGVPWLADIECLQHWEVLHDITNKIDTMDSISKKLDYTLKIISEANNIYLELAKKNMIWDTAHYHLEQWTRGINDFRNEIGV